jgi:DNA polymerase-3 subunit alpha (Gram-positive type)
MSNTRNILYVAFDFEATYTKQLGLHEIIEIGAKRLSQKSLEIVDTYHELIKPFGYINPVIREKTGINDFMLKDCKSLKEIWPSFVSFVSNSVLLVYNAAFDMNVIKKNTTYYGLEPINNKYIDVMKLAKRIYPQEISYSLDNFQKRLGIKRNTHRADCDAEVTAHLFRHLLEIVEVKYNISDIDRLNDFCDKKDNSQLSLF